MRQFFRLCAALLAGSSAVFGQYTNVLENGASQTLTNGWDAGGDMIIGGATSGNTLTLISGGSLTNVNAFVGQLAGASNNTATVSGAGAEWINTGALQIGTAGASNNGVSVSNGGEVRANNLGVAAGNNFNLNNKGTLALESGFNVSTQGFNWAAGGTLSVGGALTGLATTNEGAILSGEKTLVLNGGSLATPTDLIVGYESSNNRLAITNGATGSNMDGYLGWGAGSADNAVRVSDAGSAWTNSGNLYVGVYGTNRTTAGSGNSLTVTNDAWVFVGGEDTALTASASGGIAVADGAEMIVGETASVLTDGLYVNTNGSFELNGTLTVNRDFDADQVGYNWQDGATLVVHSNLTLTAGLDRTNQTLSINGGSWSRGGDLTIAGSGNTLEILKGGGVSNTAAYVMGSNNAVRVSNNGSAWVNNGALNITNFGNSVTVDDGGRIVADSLNVADGNDFNLNAGGTLAMTGDFDLAGQTNLNWNRGNLSVGGLLEGLAVSTSLPTADAVFLSEGQILMLDGGRWLGGTSNLVIGLNDDLSRLVLTNGGTVDNADGYIGWGASGDLNTVEVGAGSAWTNRGNLYVGRWIDAGMLVDAGVSNSLSVADGGWVFVGEGRTNGPSGGLVVSSTNGAELVVGGKGSNIAVEQTLYVGTSSSSTGIVTVASGGTVSVGNLLMATNSTFNLFGSLAVDTDFNVVQNGFVWNDGSRLAVGGALSGLDTLDGTNRTVEIAGGSWNNFTGVTGVSNTLVITEGGQVMNTSASIGNSSTDVGNVVFVDGSGSEWNLSGSLFVNPSNTLSLASTGLVSMAGNMMVSNATVAGSGTVELTGGLSSLSVYGTQSQISTNVLFQGNGGAVVFTESELVFAGSLSTRFTGFDRLSMTNSLLGGSGTVDGVANVDLFGGWIAPDGELVIEGSFTSDNTTLRVTAGADSLRTTGGLNLDGLLADVTLTNTTVSSTFTANILTSDGGLTGGFSATNFNENFLLYDFMLMDDGTTVSVTSEAAADGDLGATVAYAGIQGIRAGFFGMQNSAFVRTQQLRRNSVATDRAISHETYLMQINDQPSGPQGPGDQNTIFGMNFWVEQFSGQGDFDGMGPTEGFTLNNNGTSFGFDKLLGESLVLGVNYTYARSSASSDSGDRSNTETYWLGLYSDWVSENEYYVEGLLALGQSGYTTLRTEPGYTGEGKFEGVNFGAHIEGGKYFHSTHWAVAPYVGLNYIGIKSDAYTETSGGNEISVNGQSVASLESALGIKLRNRFDTQSGRFQTIGYVEWAYDFINDDMGSTLSDGTITVRTARIAPGASLLNTGVGLSWICTDYLEVGVGYDGRFNENYVEHLGSIMLNVRF